MDELTRAKIIEYFDSPESETGSLLKLQLDLGRGHRLGQAFYNAVSDRDKALLQGTMKDPFFREDDEAVVIAIDYLKQAHFYEDYKEQTMYYGD